MIANMEEHNPWWIGEEDYVYLEWKRSKVKWYPNIINLFSLKPYSLHFIVGPRQVGKTTAIKIFIHKLIQERNPKSIFYYSCDEIADYKELGEILDNYISARSEWGIKSSIIFLDEITFVEEWWRALKSRIDRGVFKEDVIFITGSASVEMLKQKEYFPGRRGYGKDIIFLPMDFGEYFEKFSKIKLKKTRISNLDYIGRVISGNKIYADKINELFKIYLKTGGFPIPIKEYFESGKVSISSKKIYLDWLKGDWRKDGKSDKYMKEVINFILSARLSPISWVNIARETSINSPHTARSYIETLENLYVAKVLNIITPDFKVLYRKNKKVHITDPFIYNVFSYYTGKEVLEETIVESVVACHISRVTKIYYWKNKTEIDIVSIINGEQMGFEVKWGFKGARKPRHLKKVIILTKEDLPIFLSSLNWKSD